MWILGALISPCWTRPAPSSKILFTTAMPVRMAFPSACSEIVPRREIYKSTGVQLMQINTLFQVFALAERHPDLLRAAQHFITMPDLLNYWLTGRITCEYTNATTTQMFDTRARDWARPMLEKLGLPTHILQPVIEPGTCHRTAAARTREGDGDGAGMSRHGFGGRGDRSRRRYGVYQLGHLVVDGYGSAGADRHADARAFNFTNEGGVGGTTRVLKNIMGMWLLQGCRKQWNATDYASLVALAKPDPDLTSLIDPDHALVPAPGEHDRRDR